MGSAAVAHCGGRSSWRALIFSAKSTWQEARARSEVRRPRHRRQESLLIERNAAKKRHRAYAAEEQARIAESRRLAAESTAVLIKYPQRSLLLAVEAVKVEQPLHGVRVAADEQSLREALGFIGGRLVEEPMGR